MHQKELVERAIMKVKSPIDQDTNQIKNLPAWLNQRETKKQISNHIHEVFCTQCPTPKHFTYPDVKLLQTENIENPFESLESRKANLQETESRE